MHRDISQAHHIAELELVVGAVVTHSSVTARDVHVVHRNGIHQQTQHPLCRSQRKVSQLASHAMATMATLWDGKDTSQHGLVSTSRSQACRSHVRSLVSGDLAEISKFLITARQGSDPGVVRPLD